MELQNVEWGVAFAVKSVDICSILVQEVGYDFGILETDDVEWC